VLLDNVNDIRERRFVVFGSCHIVGAPPINSAKNSTLSSAPRNVFLIFS